MTDQDLEFEVAAFKTLLTDAVCGVGFPSRIIATECEKTGMAAFIGNQHNPNYLWRRERLMKCSVDQLQELYQGLCEAREENNPSFTDEARTSSGLVLQ